VAEISLKIAKKKYDR
jgi:cell division protein FtsB